ncbi:MAG: citrate synthase [Candidatus Lokiarchaeota archaeon]|nr:citrate synthase [Candidatus Lokiarchaeota archaeon]
MKKKGINDIDNEITIYKGLVGIYIDETLISYIDGVNGKLFYRGYSIEQLVENSTFEEVTYLLIYGNLPTKSQLDKFKELLIQERDLPDNILSILKSFPRKTTRIELLRTAISALSLYDPDDYDYSEEANIRKGIRIIAKIPTLIAFAHRIQTNQSFIEPSNDLSLAGNYYYMMTGKKPDKEFEDIFDKVLICHADHSINSSTLSCRVTVSTLSDIYSGITSAIGTLRGPLHGGANETIMNQLITEVKTSKNVIPWAKKRLENNLKIMGFGHRVYKTWDPRAIILRNLLKKIYKEAKNGELVEKISDTGHDHKNDDYSFEMIEILKDYMIETKGIYPNVDLYSAGLLHSLGIPIPLFTPLFAASRSTGWVAHAIEQLANNKLIRPRLKYVGELERKYIKISKR